MDTDEPETDDDVLREKQILVGEQELASTYELHRIHKRSSWF